MKIRTNRIYPYPVLAPYNDDYINSSFTSTVSAEIYGYDLVVKIIEDLQNDGLSKLIENGSAEFVTHMECPTTGFRKTFRSSEYTETDTIPFSLLRDIVEVNTFIVAREEINHYSNPLFNEDYKGFDFSIEKGCILAQAKHTDVRIPKKITDLTEKDDPFVVIVPNKDKSETTVSFDLDETKILIIVPEQTAASYRVLQKTHSMRPILTSMFIVPALAQGLIYLRSLEPSDLVAAEDRLWVQSLEEILRTNFKLEISDLRQKEIAELFVLAQGLLNKPYKEGVQTLMTWSGGQNDED